MHRGEGRECEEGRGGGGREETAEKRRREEKTSVASPFPPLRATIKEERGKKETGGKKKQERREEERKIMHGESERGSAVCARYTFDASREWKQEDKRKRRSTGGTRLYNYGCIPFVASIVLPASRSRHWSCFLNDLFSLVTRD